MSTIQMPGNENIKLEQHQLSKLLNSVQRKIIGQHSLIEHMLVCLLAVVRCEQPDQRPVTSVHRCHRVADPV